MQENQHIRQECVYRNISAETCLKELVCHIQELPKSMTV